MAVETRAVKADKGAPRASRLTEMNDPEKVAVRFKLTIVVPVFNEERTIRAVLNALKFQPVPGDVEIIVVDDGSTDQTPEIICDVPHVRIRHEMNLGKGAAILTGIERATGTHLLVFDADSEYDPTDIPALVAPIATGRAEVVYGVRVRGARTNFPSLVYAVGNRVMTEFANLVYGSAISDLHTCLKLLPLPLLRKMELREHGFGLDTEISAEMLRLGFRPYEVAASYVGRTREEGKKIRLSDAIRCVFVLVKVRLRGRTRYGARDRSLAPPVAPAQWSPERRRAEWSPERRRGSP
jgi:glycosyltransferase involved in cell wall biosynthesis